MSTAAFAYRDFRLYQAARFFLTIAIQMQSVAVGWHVYGLTHRALDLGYVGLAQFLPLMASSLVAGHAADRFDRRGVLMVCYAVLALTSLGLAVFADRLAAIYVVLAVFGATRAFAGPAGQALLTHVVPVEVFPNAVAWGSTVWQIAAIAGPAIGGLVYGAAGGPKPVYAAAAALALLSLVLTARMKVTTGRMERKAASLETLLAGVRYVWHNKIILGSISLDLFAVLLGGAVALLPVFARDVLHTGPWGLGALRSAPALGAAAMAAWIAYRPLARRAGAVMLACVAIFGVATIVFAESRSFVLSLVALVVVGASDMVSVVVRSTLVQIATPPEMRGRVSAVNLVFIGASNELGEFESGVTAAWLGAVPAAAIGGVATIVVVAVWSLLFPALRDVDRLTDPAATSS